jgi:hypothetical protein
MPQDDRLLALIEFEARIIEWRGPAPFLFAPVPEEHSGEIRYAATVASYGWGVVPVTAHIGDVAFATSLFPRDGAYLLPIKVQVQRQANVTLGDRVRAQVRITAK